MNRDDVIRLAREAGFELEEWADGMHVVVSNFHCSDTDITDMLECFAALVAAAEREACAAKMDAIAHQCRMEDSDCEPFVYAADAIRARRSR